MEDYGVEEEEGIADIDEYFDVLYPEIIKIINDKGIKIETFSSDEDPRVTFKRFAEML